MLELSFFMSFEFQKENGKLKLLQCKSALHTYVLVSDMKIIIIYLIFLFIVNQKYNISNNKWFETKLIKL